MKTKLKGRHKYFPGELYGALMFMPTAGLVAMLNVYNLEDMGALGAVLGIVFCAVFCIFFFKIGEKIFEFTEQKYSEHKLTANHAHMWAVITEFAVFIAVVLGVIFMIPVIGKYIHG